MKKENQVHLNTNIKVKTIINTISINMHFLAREDF